MLGARDYLGSQLTLKNHDNAVALALMLSLEKPDQVKTTLLVASLFDSGHYEEIRILDPQGATLTQRKSVPAASQAPAPLAAAASAQRSQAGPAASSVASAPRPSRPQASASAPSVRHSPAWSWPWW